MVVTSQIPPSKYKKSLHHLSGEEDIQVGIFIGDNPEIMKRMSKEQQQFIYNSIVNKKKPYKCCINDSHTFTNLLTPQSNMKTPTNKKEKLTFQDRPVMKCGCVAMTINQSRGGVPWCLTHDEGEIGEQPDFSGRRARCDYYGQPVKTSMYNSNCCDTCKRGDVCRCEQDSSQKLWFFKHQPEEEYDMFYCACHGAD